MSSTQGSAAPAFVGFRPERAPRTLPDGIRERVWIEARHFFSRDDAQVNCWLWLLRDDGRVLALRMDARCHGHDEWLPAMLAQLETGNYALPEGAPVSGNVWVLEHAPVVPLPRWVVSWGHPLQVAIRAFASALDADVLTALGRLEVPGPFFGSTNNYNRLAALARPARRHRVQALEQFPAFVAPLLFDVGERPDMFGTDEDAPLHAAIEEGVQLAVLDAMDHGRDLTGELAAHYRVGRALVRSPLFREPLTRGFVPADLLQLLAAMPAHARPRDRRAFEARLPFFQDLPVLAQRAPDVSRLAQVFAGGWESTWRTLEARFPALQVSLRNSRDFLRAALEQVDVPQQVAALDVPRLGLAWLYRRGAISLLDASRRWHEQPLVDRRSDDGLPAMLLSILGECVLPRGCASEIVSREALVAEGERMHHCVGEYWEDCALHATRIFHLVAADGETATAQYTCNGRAENPRYGLAQLAGAFNRESSAQMERLADDVEMALNAEPVRERRMAALEEAGIATLSHRPGLARMQRLLDARSRRELRLVLAWASRQDDWQVRAAALLRGFVAGFAYAQGTQVRARLAVDDALQLVREPANPYDPLAVRIDWNGHKLGYVPRHENARIAAALDAGVELAASIVALHPDKAWTPVEFAIEAAPPA